MFDEPPQNLPVEPGKAPPPKNAPRPVLEDEKSEPPLSLSEDQETPAVPPAPAEPGTSRSGNEPEDMFAGVEEPTSEVKPKEQASAMPMEEKKKGSAGKIVGVLLAILILVSIIGAGVWYFFFRQVPVSVPVVVAPEQTIIEEPPVLPPETAPPAIPPPTEVVTEPVIEVISEESAVISADTDGDGLTDAEEDVFGTSRVLADSDGDTFSDGSEVANGYDPSVTNGKLMDSRYLTTVDVDSAWRLFFPTSWVLTSDTVLLGDFIIETATEDTIQVHLDQKPRIMAFEDWFASNNPGMDFTALAQGTAESGDLYWMTSDGKTAYATDGASIIRLRLMSNGSGKIDFPAVFKLISKTLEKM